MSGTGRGGTSEGDAIDQRASDLRRATLGMAVGTALSRITGVGRVFALTFALGGSAFADAYNLANTTPNIVVDIVIGGVLSATFVPVFVEYLSTRPGRDAWRAISAVSTATVLLLVVASVAFWFAAPGLISLYSVAHHGSDLAAQKATATTLLRWFVPQLAAYGIIALFTALLNVRQRFAAPMFVPVVNNVVTIVVLLWFHALVPHPTLAAVAHQSGKLAFLGIGTTAGVVLQAALLWPSVRAAKVRARFHLELRHPAIGQIARLGSWTLGIVVANQVALSVVLALAVGIRDAGALSAYTYAYTFFQLPYGIVAVSVMSAIAPSLARAWTLGDRERFTRQMAGGLRSMFAIVLPSAAGMLVLARPLITLLLAHGAETAAEAARSGATLASFAVGLPGFCAFLYAVRVLQSMQDTRAAFRVYVLENGLNVALAFLLVGPLGVQGLALSLSIAYSVAALFAFRTIGASMGGTHRLGLARIRRPVTRMAVSSVVLGLVGAAAVNVSGAESLGALLARVVGATALASLAYLVSMTVLGARDAARRHGGGHGGGHRDDPGDGSRPPEDPSGPPRPRGTLRPRIPEPAPPPPEAPRLRIVPAPRGPGVHPGGAGRGNTGSEPGLPPPPGAPGGPGDLSEE